MLSMSCTSSLGFVNARDDDSGRTSLPSSAPRSHPPPAASSFAGSRPARPGSLGRRPERAAARGVFYLAYRLRRPIGQGRGLCQHRGALRPTACVSRPSRRCARRRSRRSRSSAPPWRSRPTARWRAYVSCATAGTKHWRVDLVEAATPEGLAAASPRTVLPGSRRSGGQGPGRRPHGGRWHLWASCHPLDDPDATDRMTSD